MPFSPSMSSHSTLWISCSSWLGTRLFRFNQKEEGVRYFRDLPGTRLENGENALPEMLDTLTAELEGLTADSRGLILCGDSELLLQIENGLPGEVRERIVGRIEQDLFNVNESDLTEYLKDYLPEYSGQSEAEESHDLQDDELRAA